MSKKEEKIQLEWLAKISAKALHDLRKTIVDTGDFTQLEAMEAMKFGIQEMIDSYKEHLQKNGGSDDKN